ncbi:MAG: Ig-like domain-containing protein [Lachnospiraceae bacterium]|nr:Ig-like domain-containing protein [Lachnospiraceae bacterium]
MKRVLTTILAFALTVTGVQPFGTKIAVGAETTGSVDIGDVTSEQAFLENYSATKGVYWFDTHEAGTDYTDTFIYDEDLLKGDSLEYNQNLATMTFELAVASISSEREPKTAEGYANKSRNLRAYLEDNGFSDFDTNQYYKEKMTTRTMGVGCAHKKIVDNGKEYTLLAIVPRSAGYESEWGGNFMIGDSGDHQGFKIGKDIVLGYAKEYIEQYGISGDIKVWTSGYSRGAGVTNQVAAELIRNPKGALGESVNLEPQNLYCYTFGTPRSADVEGDYADSKYNYIHNTLEHYDIVTVAPPEKLGFARYGTVTGYADRGDKERMLKLLQQTNEIVYNLYMNGGDPDGFTPKTFDLEAMQKGEIKIIDDEDSYLPDNQTEFMALMEDSLAYVAQDRTCYYETYQDALEHLCGYFFSHMEKSGELIGGIKSNPLLIPMLVSMYVSFVVERYGDKKFDDDAKTQLSAAIEQIETIIANAEEQGTEVPDEVLKKYNELKKVATSADKFGDFEEAASGLRAGLYSVVIGSGLEAAGLPEEDAELFEALTGEKESAAISKMLTYLLLYDKNQTEEISFNYLNQQFKHIATFVGNAGSFMRPHNNEIIVSWLKTLDSNYNGITKENATQIEGYTRVYVKPVKDGVRIVENVKDADGNVVATLENGELTYRSDSWIGFTTSDEGGWLRIPNGKGYKVSVESDEDTEAEIKTSDYDTDTSEEEVYSRSSGDTDWITIKISATLPKIVDPSKLPEIKGATAQAVTSTAVTGKSVSGTLMAKMNCKGKKAVNIKWTKVEGADGYDVCFVKCGNKKDKECKVVKTVEGNETFKFKKTGLKKNKIYKAMVTAYVTVNGQKSYVSTSPAVYAYSNGGTSEYTNAKKVKVKKNKLTVTVGKKGKIKASVVKTDSKKKLMPKKMAANVRYLSSDEKVATVNNKGKVTGVAAGSCDVYAYAHNGNFKKVSVTVE